MEGNRRAYLGVVLTVTLLAGGCKSGGSSEPDPPEPGEIEALLSAPASVETHQEAAYDASCSAEDGLTDVTFIYDGEMSQPSVEGTRWDTSFVDTPIRAGEKNIEVICEDVNEQVDSESKTFDVLQHETEFDFEHDDFVQYQDGSMRLSIQDPDTLTKLTFVEEGPDGVHEFSVTPNSVGFDTTLARAYENFGSANMRVEVQTRNDTREDISFQKDFMVQETPYERDATLEFQNLFTKEGLDGYVTFPGFKTLRVENGVAQIGLEDKIDADSLANEKYRIHFEPDDSYVNHSSIIRSENGELVPVDVLPEEYTSADGTQEWDYEEHKKHLWWTRNDNRNNRLSKRWPSGADVTAYLYDESYGVLCEEIGIDVQAYCSVKTDDPDLRAEEGFVEHARDVYELVDALVDDLSITVKIESEQDTMPKIMRNVDKNPDSYAIFAYPRISDSFPLQASFGLENNWIYHSRMVQARPGEFAGSLRFGVFVDGLETGAGVNTNNDYKATVVPDANDVRFTSFVKPHLTAVYARPAKSGYVELDTPAYEHVGKLPTKEHGVYTTKVHDWVATDTTAPFEN